MLYLLLAIAGSVMISIVMRLSEKHIKNEMGMFMANYTTCILLSFLFMNQGMNYPKGNAVTSIVIMGVVSGILYLASFVFLKLNMKYNGIVMASTFMKLGVLIPTIMAIVVFKETPGWMQIIGIGIAIVAIVIIHFEKDALQESSKKIWLILLLVVSGFTDSMANIYEQFGDATVKDFYLCITFLTAFVFATLLAIGKKEKICKYDLLFGALMGIPNFFSSRCLLMSLGSVDAVLVYPMYSVGTVISVTLVGMLAFHETISKKKVLALGLIVAALILLNI